MKFVLHGGTQVEADTIKRFAHMIGACFVQYASTDEPLLVAECYVRDIGIVEAAEQVIRWINDGEFNGNRNCG